MDHGSQKLTHSQLCHADRAQLEMLTTALSALHFFAFFLTFFGTVMRFLALYFDICAHIFATKLPHNLTT